MPKRARKDELGGRADPGSEPKARFANWRGGRVPESGMASAGSRIVECHSCRTRLTLQGARQPTFTSRCPAWTLLCFVGNHQTFQCPICSAYVTDHHAAALQPAPRPVLCSNVRPLRIGDPTTEFTQIICSCMCAVSDGSDAAARSAAGEGRELDFDAGADGSSDAARSAAPGED